MVVIGALLVAGGIIALTSPGTGRPKAGEQPVEAGLVFQRIDIADKAGDVKLVGDIDGDGLPDFVLGGFPGDGLGWWRWPDLHPTEIAQPSDEFTTDGVLADVDGDGALDIVAPDGAEGVNLHWFENPRPHGDPTDASQWRRHDIGAIGSWGKDVEAADFDADGRMDFAIRSPDEAMIYFQDAGGAWTRVVLGGLTMGEEGMFSGDIDGDGDVDLLLQGVWTSNPGGAAARDPAAWPVYAMGEMNPAFKAVVVDLDLDGHPDILTSSSEHTADVAWFSADDGPTRPWTRHVIQSQVSGAHTLQAADMDGDGDIDVVVGQMHTTDERELAVHYNVDGKARLWARQVIDNVGLHNGVVADVGADGDFDIYGANWVTNPPLRVWINQLNPPPGVRRIDRWTYHQVTGAHVQSFGLAFADVDGDGRTDIVSGPFWYRQPEDPWVGDWPQMNLGGNVDAFAALDIDGDGRAEVFAQRGRGSDLEVLGLKARPDGGFDSFPIGVVPAASHGLGSQGHAIAQIRPGAIPQVAVSSGGGVFYFTAPDDPLGGPWKRVRICTEASDEGIVLVDIDDDGALDLVATTGDAKEVAWWKNPGSDAPDWERHDIGTFPEAVYPDRVNAADFDGDGRMDVTVTEENGAEENARAVWWRQPESPDAPWVRSEITSRGSLNSQSVADMDGDGDPDIVMAEHRGALRLSIWNNLGGGRFVEQLVDTGKESHLGAQTVDIDGDGDLDIVSIAYDDAGKIHLWRNDALAPTAGN